MLLPMMFDMGLDGALWHAAQRICDKFRRHRYAAYVQVSLRVTDACKPTVRVLPLPLWLAAANALCDLQAAGTCATCAHALANKLLANPCWQQRPSKTEGASPHLRRQALAHQLAQRLDAQHGGRAAHGPAQRIQHVGLACVSKRDAEARSNVSNLLTPTVASLVRAAQRRDTRGVAPAPLGPTMPMTPGQGGRVKCAGSAPKLLKARMLTELNQAPGMLLCKLPRRACTAQALRSQSHSSARVPLKPKGWGGSWLQMLRSTLFHARLCPSRSTARIRAL